MEYLAETDDIKILVTTSYNKERSNSESTYYNYTVIFMNDTKVAQQIVGRKLIVRPNTISESKDITIESMSKYVKDEILLPNDTFIYDTFSANNGPVTIRGYYMLKNLQTGEITEVKFPLTFFPKIPYEND